MKKRVTLLGITLVALMIIAVTFADESLTLMSNVYKSSDIEVTEGEPVDVSPSKPMPTSLTTAVPFELGINVTNPNNQTLSGQIMMNVTNKDGISQNDVCILSTYNCMPALYSVTATSVIYLLYGMAGGNYFAFVPGSNTNVTIVTMQYNTKGTYTISLSVYR